MRAALLEQIDLICPRCRETKGLQLESLSDDVFVLEGLLHCANQICAASFPIIQGIPVVLADMPAWWSGQRELSMGASVSDPSLGRYLDSLSAAWPDTRMQQDLRDLYLNAHYGYLAEDSAPTESFWSTMLSLLGTEKRGGVGLDLGCSVGRMAVELSRRLDIVVGIDSRFSMLVEAAQADRQQRMKFARPTRIGHRHWVEGDLPTGGNLLFVCADAMNPPLRAAEFDLVVALNLLDNVSVPLTLLQQIDALLKPEGMMLLSSPYSWRADLTEPAEWLENDALDGAAMVRAILSQDLVPATQMSYDIVDQQPNVPWILRHHDRHQQHYDVDAIVAKKVIRHASP